MDQIYFSLCISQTTVWSRICTEQFKGMQRLRDKAKYTMICGKCIFSEVKCATSMWSHPISLQSVLCTKYYSQQEDIPVKVAIIIINSVVKKLACYKANGLFLTKAYRYQKSLEKYFPVGLLIQLTKDGRLEFLRISNLKLFL